ncbi:MAG TPA: lysophospholipid acyltransferase family protein [Gemmatimonadales bacterium]
MLLRTLLYYPTVLVLTVFWGTAAIVAALFGVKHRTDGIYDQAARQWSRGLLRAAGTPVTLVGYGNVPTPRPVIYVSNHQSFFDILALAGTVPGTLRFVAKKEMASIPLLGQAMKAAGHIYIDRQNRAAAFDAYEEVALWIRDGLNTVVFPEGTRSRTGEMLPFKKGPFVLAIAAQVPVIPVYCAGTFNILPKGSVLLRPHPVTLFFGSPIETAGLTYDDRHELLRETRAAIETLRDRARTRDSIEVSSPG